LIGSTTLDDWNKQFEGWSRQTRNILSTAGVLVVDKSNILIDHRSRDRVKLWEVIFGEACGVSLEISKDQNGRIMLRKYHGNISKPSI